MYSFAIYIYSLLVRLIALLGHSKARLMVEGHQDTWRILRNQIREGERYVWFHAASLGEFEQGRPLIEHLRRTQPQRKILLTFFSPSGYEVRKNYEGADVVCYLPFDTPTAVRRFLDAARPEMLLLIKYEYWHNYITQLHQRNIPIYSVSSIFRPGQLFFQWYGQWAVKSLHRIAHFFVQNEESQQLLNTLGLGERTTVVGDTRFDRVIDIAAAARPLPIVEDFAKGHRVVIAGSTWKPDEQLLVDYFNHHPELRMVIAPHVVDEKHLQEIEQRLQRPVVRYSHATAEQVAQYECLLIDNYGLLSSIYRYGEWAYIGGGFGVSIHNVPEAAVYGIPVVFGPNHTKFREALDLLAVGGSFAVDGQEGFVAIFDRLLNDASATQQAGQAAGDYIRSHAGATALIAAHVGW